jgi:tetratricopeptide (TPR) repeat protein
MNLSANFTQSALDWFGQHIDANNPWMVAVVGGAIGAVLAAVFVERRKEKRAKASLMRQIEELSHSTNSSDAKKIEETIAKYEELLKGTSEPVAYGKIKFNIGKCRYNSAILGHDKESDLKEAIRAYKEALNIFKIKKYSESYAMAQSNLSAVCRALAEIRDKEENLKRTIEAYEQALRIYTSDNYPLLHETVKSNLEKARSMAPS